MLELSGLVATATARGYAVIAPDGTRLEGRILRIDDSAEDVVAQGDVWQAMQIWRAENGCRPDASGHGETGIFLRRCWRDCDSGRRLDFALFDGGHSVPEGWTAMVMDWFVAR
jgi:polyhydroxybutyrate depolymerase